jgi:hypothetical protein
VARLLDLFEKEDSSGPSERRACRAVDR